MTIRFGWLVMFILMVPRFGAAAEKNTAKEKLEKQLKTVERLNTKKDYDSALTIVEAILKDHTTHPAALFQRAYIFELQKKTPDAIAAYEKCLEVVLEEEPSRKSKRLIAKVKRALMKLDKSRKTVLQYAENLEREAKKYKGKDDYAYEKMMDIVSYMRGVWGEQADDESGGNKRGKKRKISKRHQAFHKAMGKDDYDDALRYVDPRLVNAVGKGVMKGILQQISGAMKINTITASDLRQPEVILGEGGKDAKVIPRFRKWGKVNDSDPQYWVLKGGKWYLGDDDDGKVFRRFKPAKKK